MGTPPEQLRAFLDESAADRRFYSISAVVINANDESRVNRAIRVAGLLNFHAQEEDEPRRQAMEDLVLSHSVSTVVSVYAPMKESVEETRQDCLAALAIALRDDTRHPVTELVMDSRDNLKVAAKKRDSRPNNIDLSTIYQINETSPTAIRLYFGDDKDRPALTMADAVAWRTRRALASGSPFEGAAEFARLAPRTRLVAADHPGHHTTLQDHLDAFRATSIEQGALARMNPDQVAAFLRQDWDARRSVLAHRTHDGAPDWLDYFGKPEQRRPSEPGRRSSWDVFAGKGTTPTIRPHPDNPDQTRRQQPADQARRPAPGQRPATDRQQTRDQQRRRPGSGAEEKTQRRPQPPQQTPRQEPRQQRRPDPPDKPRGLSR